MATGGGARGWQFLKRNDHYAAACRALTGPRGGVLDAPFPIQRQSEADLEAGPWGFLGWEDPLAANGPCSPAGPAGRAPSRPDSGCPGAGPGAFARDFRATPRSLAPAAAGCGVRVSSSGAVWRRKRGRSQGSPEFDPPRGRFPSFQSHLDRRAIRAPEGGGNDREQGRRP